ncbi:MAG: CAP domain-containing protein, partial [Chloroflexota bacterium]
MSAADPYALIDAVNAVRLSHGLAPYAANSILMNAAQQHAQYISTAGVTHYGADGSRPYQRGLAAGYPLAGDLSLGGFYSENIIAGNKMTVTEAVQAWQGDAPHLNTMLSTNLTEIGAGVVIVSDYVYFVIDCARPTGSGQTTVIKTTVPGENTSIPVDLSSIPETPVPGPIVVNTLVPVTPDGDGRIWHVVKPGETLWLIAVSYNTKVAEIRKLNNLSETQAIIPGQKLLVRQDVIASPIPITSTSFPKNTIQP